LHAFAAFNLNQTGKMPKCPETGGQRWLGAKVAHDQHGSQALEHVARRIAAASPAACSQHIRCADIARADGPISGAPAARVSRSPNGIEPSR
jgi:hypothetical protein